MNDGRISRWGQDRSHRHREHFFAAISLPDGVKCALAVLALACLSKPVWQRSCTVQRPADYQSAKTAHLRNRHSHYVRFAPKLRGTHE
jgi:hypothetical protein